MKLHVLCTLLALKKTPPKKEQPRSTQKNNAWKAAPFVVLTLSVILHRYIMSEDTIQIARQLNETYDFVIVGAGSAGCVMAHRLTESGKFSVLLLEAGENDMGNFIYDIPGYTDKAVRTHADWGYHTEPQKHAYKAYKN